MGRRHIPELDGIRGLACLLVIVLHVAFGVIPSFPGTWFDSFRFSVQPLMAAGVDLFFILSGFLISGVLMDSRGSPSYLKDFWTRRAARIFPVFYLMIVVSIGFRLLNSVYPSSVSHWLSVASLSDWYYVFFVQNFAMAFSATTGNAPLGVSWSLAIEEQFYLVLPFLVLFTPRRALAVAAVAIVIATPFIRSWIVDHVSWRAGYLITPARLDGLSLGFLIAYIVRSPRALEIARKLQPALSIIAVTLLVLQLGQFWTGAANQWRATTGNYSGYLVLICAQFSFMNLAMAMLMLSIFTRETGPCRWFLRTSLLRYAGLVSYGAYMYHQAINFGVWAAIYNTRPIATEVAQFYVPILVLALTAVVSWLSYRYYEQPIRRWATAPKRDQAASSTSAASA